MKAPEIESSTKEEREAYIQTNFRCISHCDLCGLCSIYHGKEPILVYKDYIEGKRTFQEIADEYK